MIAAILYDLDGTLLDIDLDLFFRDYFGALGPVIVQASEGRIDANSGLRAVTAATEAMCASTDLRTNQAVFESAFYEMTGVDLGEAYPAQRIASFYAEEFAALGALHGPKPGGVEAVQAARAAGLKVALATNPLFPRAAILERMRWANLSPDWFDVITSYEDMRACKPAGSYFLHVAELLGVKPDECLMVGDDPHLDLPAASVGMRTFYVGDSGPTDGALSDLAIAINEGLLG